MIQWLYEQGVTSEHCLWGVAALAVVCLVAGIVVMLAEDE